MTLSFIPFIMRSPSSFPLLLHISTYCDCNHLHNIEHDNHHPYLFFNIFVSILCFLRPYSCLSVFFQSVIHKTSSRESLFLWLRDRKEYIWGYTGCPRRNGQNYGRVFLMLHYTDTTQNTYIQSWTVTEIMAREVWNFDSLLHTYWLPNTY